ncbi:hypothetical protein EC957_003623 [Mortierella hygrophila]|uniref:Uncharacterized protein n=1 Tax=Mortierella hygrophila TaxID=979708 RepID=A0A9P6F1P6_9FUNG|nr:hypothetical protein EC957_003623 [Mortierella hygrophila]
MDLEREGVDITQHFPVIAEGKGLTVHLYTMRWYGDVLGAAHAIKNPIWLPADLTQLKRFLLSYSIHVLVAFADHAKRFALNVRDTLAGIPTSCLPLTPLHKDAEIRPYNTLTPSKYSKRSRIEDDNNVYEYQHSSEIEKLKTGVSSAYLGYNQTA